MNLHDALELAKWAIAGTAAVLVWMWGTGRLAGTTQERIEGRLSTLARDIITVNERLDRGGQKMSDLADDVQGLETRLRQEFKADLHELLEGQREMTKRMDFLVSRLGRRADDINGL